MSTCSPLTDTIDPGNNSSCLPGDDPTRDVFQNAVASAEIEVADGVPARVVGALSDFAERQAELREMELNFEFGYRLVLAMADVRDEFAAGRRENARRHRDRLEALEREHRANMSRLRARYEAEHVQNVTELELDRLRRLRRVDDPPRGGDDDDGPVSPPVSAYAARLRRVDDDLSAKRTQVSVFKRRLRRALDHYEAATVVRGALRKRAARVRKPTAKADGDDAACDTSPGTKPKRYTHVRARARSHFGPSTTRYLDSAPEYFSKTSTCIRVGENHVGQNIELNQSIQF